MSETLRTVDVDRFMAYRESRRTAKEANAELGVEPVARRRNVRPMTPRETAKWQALRNHILGVLEEELADLREVDKSRVRPPQRNEGHRVARLTNRLAASPKDSATVGLLIYLVLVLMYKYKCTRIEACRRVGDTGLMSMNHAYRLFYTYATPQEMAYLPFVHGLYEKNGRFMRSMSVRKHRC